MQLFHMDVAKVNQDVAYVAMVVHVYMLQASVPNVSSIFSDVCCKCVYLDVVYASHVYCKCFIQILRMVLKCFYVFLQLF